VPKTDAPALSQSIAWTLLSRGPFHAWHEHRELGGLERKPTESMRIGTLIHELILGGSRVVVHDFPDWRTNRAKEAKEEAIADGKTPILRKQIDAVQPAIEAIRAALASNGLWSVDFVCEQKMEWEYGGVRCVGTPDARLIEEGSATVLELKLTEHLGNHEATGRKGAGSGWAMQREAYVTGIETQYPEVAGRVTWLWAVAEWSPPYDVQVVPAAASMVELGRLQWERAIVQWRELLERGWSEPWQTKWTGGLEAPSYELTREAAALDEMIGGE
jgi:hypothetical protein